METYSDGNGGQVDTYGNPIPYGENSYYDSVNQLPITTTTTAGSYGADTSGYGMHSSGTDTGAFTPGGGGGYGMHSSGTGTGDITPGGGGGYGMHSSGTGTGDITPSGGGGYGMHSSGTGTGSGYGMHSSGTGTGAITPGGGGGYGMYSSGTGTGAITPGGGGGGTYPDPYTTTGYHQQQSHIPSYNSPAGDYDGGVVHSTTTTTNDYGEKVQIHHDTRGVVEKIKDKLHLNHHH